MATASKAEPDSPAPEVNRLLGFYDQLRRRILAWAERRGGKAGDQLARFLLTVPDIFLLLVRLSLDKDVPEGSRAMIGGALAYFILPIDMVPEGFVGPAGYVDDLVLAATILENAFDRRLEAISLRHWSGSGDLFKVLQELTGAGRLLMGDRLYQRLRRLLARRGLVQPEGKA